MRFGRIILFLLLLSLLAALVYQIPAVNSRLAWRIDGVVAYAKGVINPVGAIPTPVIQSGSNLLATATRQPTTSPDPAATPTPQPSPTPLPASISLPAPGWEKQDWNNCGPATLSMYLNYYGWDGDQYRISDLLKPDRGDRNVNVEELIFYAQNHAGWLSSLFRVGGELETLKQLLAEGIPVVIEEGYILDVTYWPNDDHWAGHYLLLTGYDDASQTFTAQDTFVGADRIVTYEHLEEGWKAFNRVYIVLFPPDREETVQRILGPHWDVAYNRETALETAQAEAAADPEDAFAWFNVGTNLVYFERYAEAAQAYDTARSLGLPQRMLRYQFGPFFAYFHSLRTDDLMAVTQYALQITDKSEEAWVWRGWGLYRQGDELDAIAAFRRAYEINPYSADAQYALEFMGASP
jgi:tetratricopeptide (TPR) repeat protein